MDTMRLQSLLWTALLLGGAALPAEGQGSVRVRLSREGLYVAGEPARVEVNSSDDGYLLVLHADPEGRVRVLFPLDPTDDAFVRGGRTYELRNRAGRREVFRIDWVEGYGTVYAAVSPDPWRVERYTRNGHWDYAAFPARVGEEPEADLTALADELSSVKVVWDAQRYRVGDRERLRAPRYAWGPSVGWGWDPFAGCGFYSVPCGLGWQTPTPWWGFAPVGGFGWGWNAFNPWGGWGWGGWGGGWGLGWGNTIIVNNGGQGGVQQRPPGFIPPTERFGDRTWNGTRLADAMRTPPTAPVPGGSVRDQMRAGTAADALGGYGSAVATQPGQGFLAPGQRADVSSATRPYAPDAEAIRVPRAPRVREAMRGGDAGYGSGYGGSYGGGERASVPVYTPAPRASSGYGGGYGGGGALGGYSGGSSGGGYSGGGYSGGGYSGGGQSGGSAGGGGYSGGGGGRSYPSGSVGAAKQGGT
ncbi:MAG: DUF4384 domain-containing protein [Gemmatimonadales bacterium]|nr:DUF4384 domain-containing protein [Gemmatimonadales bacterium]